MFILEMTVWTIFDHQLADHGSIRKMSRLIIDLTVKYGGPSCQLEILECVTNRGFEWCVMAAHITVTIGSALVLKRRFDFKDDGNGNSEEEDAQYCS